MNKLRWIGLPILLGACIALSSPACTTSSASPTATPVVAPTSTPVAAPNTVRAAGTTFSPSAMTIAQGTTVTWDATLNGHTVNIDTSAGACVTDFTTGFPHTFTFSTTGTFLVHCDIHSPCGSACSNSCTGMIMTITVN